MSHSEKNRTKVTDYWRSNKEKWKKDGTAYKYHFIISWYYEDRPIYIICTY